MTKRPSLTHHTVAGIFWLSYGKAAFFVLQLLVVGVLARLVTPTAFGVVPGYVLEHEPGLDRAATPSLGQVLAVRDRQLAELDRWLSAVTADELLMPAPVPEGPGWPPYARGKSVLECVHVVLGEEWAHHGFCERDLALLAG